MTDDPLLNYDAIDLAVVRSYRLNFFALAPLPHGGGLVDLLQSAPLLNAPCPEHLQEFLQVKWPSVVMYEDIYINDYATVRSLDLGLPAYFCSYNRVRPHPSLDYRTPAHVYQSTAQLEPTLLIP